MTIKPISQNHRRPALFAAMASIWIACLCACSSSPKGPIQYSINGEGDEVLNRDINGRSLSVVVRLYQLREANEFSKLTFDTLAAGHSESELLGPSLISKTDLVLVPGGTYANPMKLQDETRYVGIVGMFRNPDPHHWRRLIDVLDKKGNRIAGVRFRAKDCYIEIIDSGQLLLPGQPSHPKGECGLGNATPTLPLRPPQGINSVETTENTSPVISPFENHQSAVRRLPPEYYSPPGYPVAR